MLASIDIVVPDRWRAGENPSHNGLYELVVASSGSRDRLDEFKRFLGAQGDQDVLFSAEAISTWLRRDDMRKNFLRLLVAAQDLMPTRCIWTLRRFDALLESMYLRRLGQHLHISSPAQFFEEAPLLDSLFDAMHGVEEALSNDVVYVKYEHTGAHNGELLRAFGIPVRIGKPIREELDHAPRRNTSLTHKEAVVFANLEVLSARAAVDLDAHLLRVAFWRDGFRFEGDRRCALVSGNVRRDVHERALAAARRHGIASYPEFFEDAEIGDTASSALDPETISDRDLERLVAHLYVRSPAEPGRGSM
jgi:hypothetical protein